MIEQGGRWSALRRALQFVALLHRGDFGMDPVSCVTTGVHKTFELMVRRRAQPLCSWCTPFSVMGWTDLKRSTSTFPLRGNGKRLLFTAVRCSPRTVFDSRTSYSNSRVGNSTLNLTFKNIWRALTPNGRND